MATSCPGVELSRKRLLAVNAISLSAGGGRAVLRAFLDAFVAERNPQWMARVFVRDAADLPRADTIEYVVPSLPLNSWVARLWWEALGMGRALAGAEVNVFLSLQSSGANVLAEHKYIYCHNALPLARYPSALALAQPKVAALRLIYDQLYRFTIADDATVIVQHQWTREALARKYGLKKTIVAFPDLHTSTTVPPAKRQNELFEIIYPVGPYNYKNPEVLCEAARLLSQRCDQPFRVTLTVDGSENAFTRRLVEQYQSVPQLAFVGTIPPATLLERYLASDLLVFPSLIESWGLPLTEAKACGLGILAADLPYAHETVGNYERADFFDPHDARRLADRILGCWKGYWPLDRVAWPKPTAPFFEGWRALVRGILN